MHLIKVHLVFGMRKGSIEKMVDYTLLEPGGHAASEAAPALLAWDAAIGLD